MAMAISTRMIPLNEQDAKSQAKLFKALSDPNRLRLLSLLSKHEGEVCVFEIVDSFTLEQPTISHHLRILQESGLVEGRKKSLFVYYHLCRDAFARAQGYIEALMGSEG